MALSHNELWLHSIVRAAAAAAAAAAGAAAEAVQTTAEEVGDYYRGHITHTVASILFDATSYSQ